jgi:hypothetical protein
MPQVPEDEGGGRGQPDTPRSGGASGRRPDDAEAFVREVERATNAYDATVIGEIFAERAVQEIITDGGRDLNRGVGAIASSWAADCDATRSLGLQVRKRLLAVTSDSIINDWAGSYRGRGEARGVEVWRFDPFARVIDHRLYGFLRVRPSMGPLQGLRMLVGSPRIALTFGRHRLRSRRGAALT